MRHLFRQRLRKSVIVTLKSGTAFRGILFTVDPELLVLRKADAIERGTETPVSVDGEVLIFRTDVDFMQFP